MIKQIFTVTSQMFIVLYSNNNANGMGKEYREVTALKNVAVRGSLKKCGGNSS